MLIEDFEIKNKLLGEIESFPEVHNYKLQQIISQNNNLIEFNLQMLKNVYDGAEKNIFNFFYQLLKKWNENSAHQFDDTNWRMMQKLYEFIYLYIKKIEFSSKSIRSKNLVCLFQWYNQQYPTNQNKRFSFFKKKNLPFKIDQNHIRDTFKEDRQFQIKNYKRRQFVEKNFKPINRKQLKLSVVQNSYVSQETIKRKLLQEFNKEKQMKQIQELINQNISQKNKLKEKHNRHNSSNIVRRNYTQIFEKKQKENRQQTYLRESYASIKELKLIKIDSKQNELKKFKNSASALKKKMNIYEIQPIQGITLIENPLYLSTKLSNKKLIQKI